ncbi:hypothetical protein Tco_0667353 [Tanacetum coccineum]
MVAFLEKSTGSVGFHQIIDFITRSHIFYALTKKPEVCVSFIKQFWRFAEALTDGNGVVKINATIDEIEYEQFGTYGYQTDSEKITFPKGAFSPQRRCSYFIIFLQLLKPNEDSLGAVIKHQFQQHTRTYHVPSLTMKVFSNMKRPTKGFSGQEVALFPTMLDDTEPSTSPSRITSSPSPSPEPTPAHTQPSPTQPSPTQASPTQPSPSQPSPTQPTPPGSEHHLPTPHDSPLHVVHSHGSDEGSLKLQELMNLVTTLSDRIGVLEADLMKTKKTYSSAYTKLILRVKKLESQIKIGKARKQTRVVLSDDEAFEDDSSNSGRKLYCMTIQEKASEKASDEVSTAGAKKDTTAEEVPIVSTAEVDISTAGGTVTYVRRSAEKRSRQDKGKAIMFEEEPKKKSKKELEQERLSYAEAIRLEEQMNEEQRAQIARDEEIAAVDEEERKRAMDEAKTTKKIDWNDPSVIRYHSLKMKPKTIAQARRNMIKYLKNQGNFKISDFKEHGSGKQKSPQKSPEKSPAKEKSPEKVVEEESETQEELKEGVKEPAAKRKKSIPRKSTRKRQKLEEDAEKDELKGFLDIVPREEAPIEREKESSKNYKVLSEMLEDFDRLDVEELYRLVKNRYSASSPRRFCLMLAIDNDIVKTVVNLSVNASGETVNECQKCLELKTELLNKKDFVDKETYDKLCKSFTTLEKHCITLEVDSQLNQEIFQQENSVLNQNAPSFTQLFELSELRAQSQAKDTVIVKLKEQIKSLNGNVEDSIVKMDMDEIETLNIELEHRVTKLVTENEHLKQTYKQLYDSIKPKRVQSKEQCDALIQQVNIKSGEISDLNAKLQEQGLVIAALKNELRKLKGKALDNEDTVTHSVDPKVSKDNMEPITPKLLNKRTAHSSYIKHTQEEALVLRDIVEHVKANYPQDPLLESAFRYTKVIQDLLSHISRSCPSINNCGPQLIEVIPRKKDKKVRFAESLTSTENTKPASTSNIVSNKRVLHSTGVRLSTSASGSQPSGNTKNDRILQTPSSNSKNKVEAHPRNVKSSLNKRHGTVNVNGSAVVQNLKKQDNSDYVCIHRDDCMSSDNLCVSNSMNDVKSRAKSKKHKSKKDSWKPTGKVFTQIGYIWRPTGRTFTIVGNACPLTRITTTNEVPSRKPIVLDSESPKPVVKLVYSRKPRKNKNAESVSKTKVVQIVLWYLDSGCSKHMTGDRSQLTNFISKFLGTVKFGNDQVAKIMGFGDYQIGNVTISRVYYVEGLGHNLFSY